MSVSKNFSELWEFLKELDYYAGTFLIHKPSKWTWKEKVLRPTVPLFLLNGSILCISTMFLSNFSLISIIFGGSGCTLTGLFVYIFWTLWKTKAQVIDFLDWCQNLYEIEKKFHPVIQRNAEIKLKATQQRILKIVKLLRIFLYSEWIACTVGFAFIGVFLPENLYPKYSLPLPYRYPFNKENTLLGFIFGLLLQVKIGCDAAVVLTFIFAIFYCVISHIAIFLDIIKATIRCMKDEIEMRLLMEEEEKEFPEGSPDKIEPLDRQTLSDILESIKNDENTEEKLTFDEGIKIIVNMINDVNEIFSKVCQFLTKILLFTEMASLADLFIAGMIFLVLRQQYLYGCVALSHPLLLFAICRVNEMILDKFTDIKDEFYNIPWYAMKVKDQKTLLVAMECENIQRGFTASGFHKLNVEQFAKLVKNAYNNCIILRDVINK